MKYLPFLCILLFASCLQAEENSRWKLSTTEQQECGVMLGGIGSGFLELWPDGCIHSWSIFNRGHWGYREDFWNADKEDRLPLLDMNQDALQFFIRAAAPDGKVVGRRLSVDGEQTNVYSANNWMQNVESIDYEPTFPGATLTYHDPTLPVQVTGQFFSPIIPHDLKDSGTPGCYMIFTLHNTSKDPQEVSLASYLRNPLATGGDAAHRGAAARQLHTTVTAEGDAAYLTMRTEAGAPFQTTLGSLCLSMSGGEPSWIAQDFREFLLGRTLTIEQWNQHFETPLRDFRKTGVLPNSSEQTCPTALGTLLIGGGKQVNLEQMPDLPGGKKHKISVDVAKLSDEEVAQILAQAKQIPSLQALLEQAQLTDPTYLDPAKNGREMVDILRQAVSQYAGTDGKANGWGDSMLSTKLTLQPGEEKQVRVVLSWYFPNHPSPFDEKRNMGHMYSNWFKDAEEVNRFLASHYEAFSTKVNAFRHVLGDSNLPSELITSVSSQLNTMISSSWWTQDDKVGIWEGLGCCGLNTVDVAYQGSHPLAALFPEFEKNWTSIGMACQNPLNGHLYHTLPSDLDKGDTKNSGYGYIEVNCCFTLILCRDYLYYGGQDYLKEIYPHVIQELGVFEKLDTDGDGLPDQHTTSTSYDTWEMRGTPSYVSSVWIGALRAGIRMAHDMGDTANEQKWQAILDKAVKSFDAKLWNGEYYSLWVDGDQRDECCMADQLSGEMYTRLIGLGNSLPPDRVRSVMATIYKNNFGPDQGLWNGVYPEGREPKMPAFQNVQAEGNWTGIEYATAAAMIDQGLVDEGMNVIKAVQRRYLRASREFNHEECGPHYYRPMSIWAALLATTGFKVDAPQGILTIAPQVKQDVIHAPWVSATAWGEFERIDSAFDLSCLDGEETFSQLRVNVPNLHQAEIDGKAVPCQIETQDGLTVLKFSSPLTLKAGQKLNLR